MFLLASLMFGTAADTEVAANATATVVLEKRILRWRELVLCDCLTWRLKVKISSWGKRWALYFHAHDWTPCRSNMQAQVARPTPATPGNPRFRCYHRDLHIPSPLESLAHGLDATRPNVLSERRENGAGSWGCHQPPAWIWLYHSYPWTRRLLHAHIAPHIQRCEVTISLTQNFEDQPWTNRESYRNLHTCSIDLWPPHSFKLFEA